MSNFRKWGSPRSPRKYSRFTRVLGFMGFWVSVTFSVMKSAICLISASLLFSAHISRQDLRLKCLTNDTRKTN